MFALFQARERGIHLRDDWCLQRDGAKAHILAFGGDLALRRLPHLDRVLATRRHGQAAAERSNRTAMGWGQTSGRGLGDELAAAAAARCPSWASVSSCARVSFRTQLSLRCAVIIQLFPPWAADDTAHRRWQTRLPTPRPVTLVK